jgi:hypothetical protein
MKRLFLDILTERPIDLEQHVIPPAQNESVLPPEAFKYKKLLTSGLLDLVPHARAPNYVVRAPFMVVMV